MLPRVFHRAPSSFPVISARNVSTAAHKPTIVDLSRPLQHRSLCHPFHPPFVMTPWDTHQPMIAGKTIFRTASYYISMSDHSGTHVDAPKHFDPTPTALSVDQMPLSEFYTEGICLDLSHAELGAAIGVGEMETALLDSRQEIKQDDTVLLYMAYNKRVSPDDPRWQHDFPGLAPESVHWLADRGCKIFGVEAVSPAPEGELNFIAHNLCGERGMMHIEGLDNLESLVGQGRFRFIGFPLKLVGGSGSPIRAVAPSYSPSIRPAEPVSIASRLGIFPSLRTSRTLEHTTSATMTTATFKYIDPTSFDPHANEPFKKPWNKVDGPGYSYKLLDRESSVENLRGQETNFTTDNSGFAVYQAPTKKTFDAQVKEEYYAEVEELLRNKLPGVKKVVIFDHTIRRREKGSARSPVQLVHLDQTPKAAEMRVRRHIPEAEAEELLKGRYQIINVWRPIENPASDFPLAVIDWRSLRPSDLVKVNLLYPKSFQELGEVAPDPG
ncbi:unnamed protein product [Penicillium salamii]|nr:unnamed protein product [Penicillium salamii]